MERPNGPDRSTQQPVKVPNAPKGLDESLEDALVARRELAANLPLPTPITARDREIHPFITRRDVEQNNDNKLAIPTGATHYTDDGVVKSFWRENGPSPNLKLVLLDRWVDGDWKTETGFLPWSDLKPIMPPPPSLKPAFGTEQMGETASNGPDPMVNGYPCELKGGLSAAEVMLYNQVREECLKESSGSLVKDYFFADYGRIDPAENYWAALVEFPADFDDADPVFEGVIGAVVRGPMGNDYEVGSSVTGQMRFFGPYELENVRQRFVEWKYDRY